MLVCIDVRSCNDEDEFQFKKRALKDAVICIGWLKLLSTICNIILYFLVSVNSQGTISILICIMILAVIPFIILNAVLLLFGASEEKTGALKVGIIVCLAIAAYNVVLGAIGGVYFIRKGYLTMHFILACTFGVLALSIFSVFFHDVLIIYAYKNLLSSAEQS